MLKFMTFSLLFLAGCSHTLKNKESSGGLTTNEINKTTKKNLPTIEKCYEKYLVSHPGVSGFIKVKYIINSEGRVGYCEIDKTNFPKNSGNKSLQNCIIQSIENWKFPKPRKSQPVTVTYPFKFNSDSKDQ